VSSDAALLERLAPSAGVGARAERGRAFFDAHGLPDPKAEAWRYTPVTEIRAALEHAVPAPSGSTSSTVADRPLIDALAGSHGGPRLVFVDGRFSAELSDVEATPGGLWIGDAEALRPRRAPGAPAPQDEPADGFHALNWAAGSDVAAVLVDADTHLDVPVHVVHLSTAGSTGSDGPDATAGADATVTHPRTVVRVGAGSTAAVIESFVGTGGPSITNSSTRVVAAEGATVTYHRVMSEPAEAIHVGRTGIEQAAHSRVAATSVITDGRIVRNAVDVVLGGDGARSDLSGLYLPTDHQRHDNVVTVDHVASHGTSTQRFKGIVDDHGRGSFSGHVIVRHGTVGTDAAQSNPNLVLTPTAQADTRPWLEIFADDVRCTHGATVGRLDDDALFYLRSRGIPTAQARAMLIAAFAAEVVDSVTPESLREHLSTWLHTRTVEVSS